MSCQNDDTMVSVPVPDQTGLSSTINDETSTGIYSAGPTSGITTVRCPQGKVFKDSWKLYVDSTTDSATDSYQRVDDEAYASYSGSSWLDDNRETSEQWTTSNEDYTPSENDLEDLCIPESCEPLSIIDSDKEAEPLVGTTDDAAQSVTCNEGYVFDHDRLHRTGRVTCDYLPKFPGEPLKTKNEVTWLVHNPHLEEICESKVTLGQDACEQATDPLNADQEIGCVWIPEYSDDDGFTKQGECRFLVRADENETNPICKPMYCGERSIPNSDRVSGRNGPLPGPSTEREHGSCIDFDGQIIDAITNSSDCNCYTHKSCDTCTDSPDCQWCGYSDRGEGGFCFSTKTDLQICNTHIRNNNTGTCTHVLQPDVAKEPPLSGDPEKFNSEGEYLWSRSECETNTCANESNWNNGVEDSDTLTFNGSVVDRDSLTLDECMSLNNRWNAQGAHNYTDKCIFTNRGMTDTVNQLTRLNYYPYTISNSDDNENSSIYISTRENICVPQDSDNLSLSSIESCNNHLSKSECESESESDDTTCQWIQNPLRDSLFHWTTNYRLRFTGDNCPISDTTEEVEGYTPIVSANHIQLLDAKNFNSDTHSIDSCYLNTGDIFGYDLFTGPVCSEHGGRYSDPTACRNGVAYCDSEQSITIDGTETLVCPEDDLVTIEGTTIEGCYYSPISAGVSEDNYCHSDLVEPRCSQLGDNEPYNCTKNHLMVDPTLANSENNGETCLRTGYTPGDNVSVSDNFQNLMSGSILSELKNYLVCGLTSGNAESQCNYIGEQHAHYGKFCQSSDENSEKYPVKHICKALGYQYTIEDGERVCLNSANEPVNVCEDLNQLERDRVSDSGSGADPITWTETQVPECILDSEEFTLTELCESSENHQDGFDYINSESIGDYTGVCEAFDESRQFEVNDIRTAYECEQNNKVYVQKYDYYNTGTCETLEDRLDNQPDRPTTWTGGEISMEEQGVHHSECSASIMSSCNVDCDEGYGGGGEYICHYNSDGADVCDQVNDMSFIELDGVTKQQACERYPSCVWDGTDDTCSPNSGSDLSGHMEWLGTECYQLNNDAFAHGIAPMPELDELVPPMVRIIIFIVLLLVVALPLGTAAFYYVIIFLGYLLEGITDSFMGFIKKVIDFNFQSSDIPYFISSKFSNVMSMDTGSLIAVLLIAPLVIGFGIIYGMNQLNEYISVGADYLASLFAYTLRYIYTLFMSMRISRDGIDFGTTTQEPEDEATDDENTE